MYYNVLVVSLQYEFIFWYKSYLLASSILDHIIHPVTKAISVVAEIKVYLR